MAKTGIELVAEPTSVARRMGGMPGYRLRVKLEGKVQQLPLFGPHVLECEPGEHDLRVALGDWLGPLSISALMSRQTIRVPVDAGMITQVCWRAGKAFMAGLEITGQRPG